jgi:tetratricopeptide (TPR) repeat protein
MRTRLSFMQTYHPIFLVFLFLQFLFPPFCLGAQEVSLKIGGEEFPIVLKENDLANELPGMTYIRNRTDFIEAKGQGFQKDPPDSNHSFEFEGEKISNIGLFNQKIISLLDKKNKIDLIRAKSMALFGVKKNPIYFPLRYNLARIYSIEGNMTSSLEEYRRASELIPDYYRTHLNMGKIYEALQMDRKAEIAYKEAIRLSGFEEESKFALCSLSLTSKNVNTYRDFSEKQRENPISFHASLCIAKRFAISGNMKKAFEIVKNLNPEKEKWTISGEYYYFLGELAIESFQKKIAKEAFKKVLENPHDPLFFKIKFSTLEKKIRELE